MRRDRGWRITSTEVQILARAHIALKSSGVYKIYFDSARSAVSFIPYRSRALERDITIIIIICAGHSAESRRSDLERRVCVYVYTVCEARFLRMRERTQLVE